MTLYRLLHLGKDRPFDQTPDDRARDSSRLKTIGLIVGITARDPIATRFPGCAIGLSADQWGHCAGSACNAK